MIWSLLWSQKRTEAPLCKTLRVQLTAHKRAARGILGTTMFYSSITLESNAGILASSEVLEQSARENAIFRRAGSMPEVGFRYSPI